MTNAPKRIDLHCHSDASNKTGEAMLNMISCPESYSRPQDVYAQALRRGMDFVTLTDHDTIAGALRIADMPDVLVGEEVTVRFPEDGCKIHLLVFGHTQAQHDELQAMRDNIYDVANYLLKHNLAHSVAHPIYRQNDMLFRWHLERMLLLFKGFECLNGAHSPVHREAFEPLLDKLTESEIERLAHVHGIDPLWPEPHVKSRTAGSDDHGQLNIGRTYTEFPADTETVEDVLEALRTGRTAPGGESGSTPKLAHQFYGVAMRYYAAERNKERKASLAKDLLNTLTGHAPMPSKTRLAWTLAKSKVRKSLALRKEPDRGTKKLGGMFFRAARRHSGDHPELWTALREGLPPLGEHEKFFELVNSINRDVSSDLVEELFDAFRNGQFARLFDGFGAVLAHQFVLAPYYFALFHQNKERKLLPEITRQTKPMTAGNLKVGLFTDTLDEINGVGRFIRDMGVQAGRIGRDLTIHTSVAKPVFDVPNRRNFEPLLSRPMPYYAESDLSLNIPPLLEMLEFVDRQQYDVIHISTPGPVGIVGYAAAKMLRVPVLMTYHTDFPAYVQELTGDHRIAGNCRRAMSWLYGQAAAVFSRSVAYQYNLRELGVAEEKLRLITPGIDTEKFRPQPTDLWDTLPHADRPNKLLYVGRVSVEKNLPLLVETFKQLAAVRNDVRLVVAGVGPYLETMKAELAGLPVHFTGGLDDEQLRPLYAGADLFVFPSRTDTLGQVVMEAQASALPAIVSETGGPRETIEDNITGLVRPATDPTVWTNAINELLDQPGKLAAMRVAAEQRRSRWSLERTFEGFWAEHLAAVVPPPTSDHHAVPTPVQPPMPA
ncbi:MAG: glycosyltransferase [Planctomycetota bacterium]